MFKYAGIIINSTTVALDKIFTYAVPNKLNEKSLIGSRVMVPFGRGDKKTEGFIFEIFYQEENIKGTKQLISMLDEFPLFTEDDVKIIKEMRNKYLCTYIEGIKTIIPSGISSGVSLKREFHLYPGTFPEGKFNKEPYTRIYNILNETTKTFNKNSLAKEYQCSISSINTMIKHGFIIQNQQVVHRYNLKEYEEYKPKELNLNQKEILSGILESNNKISLIHGVTGSGKTEIYMNIVTEMIKTNKDSIILVPEISLTPQMVERFKGRFGKNISVFHSRLSLGERYDEWMRIKDGQVKVAIGARSAIFLPFNNIGAIIIDEEHEGTYKSDSDPKYDTREIAEMKSILTGCRVILGSATPSLETYYKATKGDINLFTLNKRADSAKMPKFHIVDMRDELKNNNRSIFSRELYKSIEESLSRKEQIILFLNRRGFSTFVSCRSCGYVFKCENCDISLTYHSDSNMLTCHYCGKSHVLLKNCPKCNSKYVKHFGVGTERIEEEIKRCFPSANTLRMDFDTTRKKDSYEKIYDSFKNGYGDILIGTQMIAKGLDFKNVTLVGIIASDLSLNLPDFRASERTFQLITQVSGRAGRGSKEGTVVVQSYNPENYCISHAVNNDYLGFYNDEIDIRKTMNYPPFSTLMVVNISSEDEGLLIKCIQNVGIILKNIVENCDKIDMLGPNPCILSKIKKQYRWQILFKGEINYEFASFIRKTIYESTKDVYNSIRISLDINPSSLL